MSRPQTRTEESLAGGALVNPEMTAKETRIIPILLPIKTTVQMGNPKTPAVVAADNVKLITQKELKGITTKISKSVAQELSVKNLCKWWSTIPIATSTCAICLGKSQMRSSSNCFLKVEQLLVHPSR